MDEKEKYLECTSKKRVTLDVIKSKRGCENNIKVVRIRFEKMNRA